MATLHCYELMLISIDIFKKLERIGEKGLTIDYWYEESKFLNLLVGPRNFPI